MNTVSTTTHAGYTRYPDRGVTLISTAGEPSHVQDGVHRREYRDIDERAQVRDLQVLRASTDLAQGLVPQPAPLCTAPEPPCQRGRSRLRPGHGKLLGTCRRAHHNPWTRGVREDAAERSSGATASHRAAAAHSWPRGSLGPGTRRIHGAVLRLRHPPGSGT